MPQLANPGQRTPSYQPKPRPSKTASDTEPRPGFLARFVTGPIGEAVGTGVGAILRPLIPVLVLVIVGMMVLFLILGRIQRVV